jgi:hypothetical protein
MTTPAQPASPNNQPSPPKAQLDDPAAPGLPCLRSWRGVYLAVLGCFVLWVAVLAALTLIFS